MLSDRSHIDLKNLKRERERLVKRLSLIDSLIVEYSETDPELDLQLFLRLDSKIQKLSLTSPFEVDDDFPKKATWLKQLLHLLDKHERFLGNSEMAELLLPYYPDKSVDGLKRRVSVVISDAYMNKKVRGLVKLKIANFPQGFVWGYSKWLDTNENIRHKHRPFRYRKSPTM